MAKFRIGRWAESNLGSPEGRENFFREGMERAKVVRNQISGLGSKMLCVARQKADFLVGEHVEKLRASAGPVLYMAVTAVNNGSVGVAAGIDDALNNALSHLPPSIQDLSVAFRDPNGPVPE